MEQFLIKNSICIIVVLFMIFSLIKGYRYGFIKKIFSFGSFLLAILLTRIISPAVVEIVKDNTNVIPTLNKIFIEIFVDTKFLDNLNMEAIPDFIKNIGNLKDVLSINEAKEYVATSLSNLVVYIIVSVGILIIMTILIKLIIRILDLIEYIPFVNVANKILGGTIGILESIFVLWVIFAVIKGFSIFSANNQVEMIIRNNGFTAFFYDNNLIYNFFSAFRKI